MELREGYKKTEVGIIPNEWEVLPLFQTIDTGRRWSFTGGPFGSNLKSSDYTSEGIRVIQLQNIGDGIFINDSEIYTSIEKADELLSCNIYPGDIILSKMGDPVARACIIPTTESRYVMCSDGIRYVPNPKNFETYFVFEYLNSKVFREKAINESTGSTRKRIGLNDLKKLPVLKPTLEEQQAIATALSDVDTLITNLDKLIAKKKAIKQGAMQRLLKSPAQGGQRLPGFEGGWVETTLGQIILRHQLGGNYPNDEVENSYPLIKMGNLNRGTISLSKLEFISNNIVPNEIDRLKFGDLLFNTRNTLDLVGKIAVWRNELDTAFFNSNIMRIEFKKSYVGSTFFMNYLLNTKKYLTALKAVATGTTSVAAIYTRDLLKLELIIPPPEEQKAIASILSDMDKEIESLETKKSKYLRIKQGMMQELLTGKTRLV
jgi:type I restriction enzyme S subunit